MEYYIYLLRSFECPFVLFKGEDPYNYMTKYSLATGGLSKWSEGEYIGFKVKSVDTYTSPYYTESYVFGVSACITGFALTNGFSHSVLFIGAAQGEKKFEQITNYLVNPFVAQHEAAFNSLPEYTTSDFNGNVTLIEYYNASWREFEDSWDDHIELTLEISDEHIVPPPPRPPPPPPLPSPV